MDFEPTNNIGPLEKQMKMEKYRHDMLTHGVYVVTAQHEGKRGGMTAAWATQTAVNHILVCIGKNSATRELILASNAFGFNILTVDQIDLAWRFGRASSREVDKFERLPTHTLETGSPLLDECAAAFDCRVQEVFDSGNHKLIVGEIVAAERMLEDYQPLIYSVEDY
ncbi:MAG: flavin reductase family protein [Anaerolineaceae bacterium]|nr:flavin reductase family protein [Anaerolineaceae bacterium]